MILIIDENEDDVDDFFLILKNICDLFFFISGYFSLPGSFLVHTLWHLVARVAFIKTKSEDVFSLVKHV